MHLSNNIIVFLELLKVGLWGNGNPDIRKDGTTDWNEIYQLAQEQSVQGLVLAGLEYSDVKPPQALLLQWIGEVQIIEQRNKEMNAFIADLIEKLRKYDIYAILVKGQGIARCYEKPLWRSSGDVDLLLEKENYTAAKRLFDKIGKPNSDNTILNVKRLHLGYNINKWIVELHGTLHTGISHRLDNGIDEVQDAVFSNKEICIWQNGPEAIPIPSPDNDVIFIFTHILHHLFQGGVGLRQLCDLGRLLWTYRGCIDKERLLRRLESMRILSEWRVVGGILVNNLGMPSEAMPFYDVSYKKKANRLLKYILEVGNFGHNKDYSYYTMYSPLVRKGITFLKQSQDSLRLASIFPIDAPRFLWGFINSKREDIFS